MTDLTSTVHLPEHPNKPDCPGQDGFDPRLQQLCEPCRVRIAQKTDGTRALHRLWQAAVQEVEAATTELTNAQGRVRTAQSKLGIARATLDAVMTIEP